MIILTANGTAIELDDDLYWSDEYTWSPIQQSIDWAADGALMIDEFEKQAGRPITLQPPAPDAAWLPGVVLRQLQALAALPELEMSLTVRSTTFAVMFRRNDGPAIEAEPVEFQSDPEPGDIGDQYLVTLRFIEI